MTLHFERADAPYHIPDALSPFEYEVHGYIWAEGESTGKFIVQTAALADALELVQDIVGAADRWREMINSVFGEDSMPGASDVHDLIAAVDRWRDAIQEAEQEQ